MVEECLESVANSTLSFPAIARKVPPLVADSRASNKTTNTKKIKIDKQHIASYSSSHQFAGEL
jgi:hypothetical protein